MLNVQCSMYNKEQKIIPKGDFGNKSEEGGIWEK
jgi:hypothetical protein